MIRSVCDDIFKSNKVTLKGIKVDRLSEGNYVLNVDVHLVMPTYRLENNPKITEIFVILRSIKSFGYKYNNDPKSSFK